MNAITLRQTTLDRLRAALSLDGDFPPGETAALGDQVVVILSDETMQRLQGWTPLPDDDEAADWDAGVNALLDFIGS